MTKEVIEKKIEELKSKKQEFINSATKAQQEVDILKRNIDACDGAIFSLGEVLKDINLEVTPSEEVKA